MDWSEMKDENMENETNKRNWKCVMNEWWSVITDHLFSKIKVENI